MNITEDYCSFEVAKMLKEKGFDWRCNSHYWSQDLDTLRYSDCPQNWNCASDDWYSCPTHQMAMKWLREVHSLCICIYYLWPCGYEIDLYRIGKDTPISEFEAIREYGYDTYEGAVEAALKYCLENLI